VPLRVLDVISTKIATWWSDTGC